MTEKNVYQDSNVPNDLGTGLTPATAKKTVHAASLICLAGDTLVFLDGQSTEFHDSSLLNVNTQDVNIYQATGDGDVALLLGADSGQSVTYSNMGITDPRGDTPFTAKLEAAGTITGNVFTWESDYAAGGGPIDSCFIFGGVGGVKVLTDLTIDAPNGACLWAEDGGPITTIDGISIHAASQGFVGSLGDTTGGASGAEFIMRWNASVGGIIEVDDTSSSAVMEHQGGNIAHMQLIGLTLHATQSTLAKVLSYQNPAASTITLSGGTLYSGGVCDGLTFPRTSGTGEAVTVEIVGTYFDCHHAGVLTTGSGVVVNKDTVVIGGHVRVNCNKTVTLTNAGTCDVSGLAMMCLGADSIHGGPIGAYLEWKSSGSLNSLVANLDLTLTKTVYVQSNLTITQNGGHTVTDSANTVYLQSPGMTVSFSGWTPLGSVQNFPTTASYFERNRQQQTALTKRNLR